VTPLGGVAVERGTTVSVPTSLAKSRVRIAAVEGGTCALGTGEHWWIPGFHCCCRPNPRRLAIRRLADQRFSREFGSL
jgi:hypothetical protein